MAQVLEESFDNEKQSLTCRLNKTTKYSTDNKIILSIPRLDKDSLRIIGFADSSSARNHDLLTQLGHICLLSDKKGNSVPL